MNRDPANPCANQKPTGFKGTPANKFIFIACGITVALYVGFLEIAKYTNYVKKVANKQSMLNKQFDENLEIKQFLNDPLMDRIIYHREHRDDVKDEYLELN